MEDVGSAFKILKGKFIRKRDLDTKKTRVEVFGELRNAFWRRREKIKWSEKVTNEKVRRRCF